MDLRGIKQGTARCTQHVQIQVVTTELGNGLARNKAGYCKMYAACSDTGCDNGTWKWTCAE